MPVRGKQGDWTGDLGGEDERKVEFIGSLLYPRKQHQWLRINESSTNGSERLGPQQKQHSSPAEPVVEPLS